ncbi:MAG: NUDIX hydrolase [Eubacteriales bacterium]
MEELSAGGVVFFRNTILLLKKFNGDYVLPKGRVEEGETLKAAAKREVMEESGSRVNVLEYLSKISYEFVRNTTSSSIHIRKIVHWYIMEARDMECHPQKNEGFIAAGFYPIETAVKLARYDDERNVIKKAIREMKYVNFNWT